MKTSEDGRSNESGTYEIYIRSFPEPGERTVVSRGGGAVPFWTPDGTTLYYAVSFNGPIIAARLQLDPVPVVLSTDRLPAILPVGTEPTGSALHPDVDRFRPIHRLNVNLDRGPQTWRCIGMFSQDCLGSEDN